MNTLQRERDQALRDLQCVDEARRHAEATLQHLIQDIKRLQPPAEQAASALQVSRFHPADLVIPLPQGLFKSEVPCMQPEGRSQESLLMFLQQNGLPCLERQLWKIIV